MAQFDVYANPNPESQQSIPYLLDIQADLLEHLATRVVAPLYQQSNIIHLLQRLNPNIRLNGEVFILSIAEMSAVSLAYLGEPIHNAGEDREHIIAAVDLLITGV